MYAFTDELQTAWQALFDALRPTLAAASAIEPILRFETDEATLKHPALCIGQTCGYPLIKFYPHDLLPLTVPVFDAKGCEGIYYRSAIIVASDSHKSTLPDFADGRVVINGPDSNSGMNLLRAELIRLHKVRPFFASTTVSGSHLDSVRSVAEHRADLAAIDCVSLALLEEAYPELTAQVKIIGYTEKSAGLPFVVPAPHSKSYSAKAITALFNRALGEMAPAHKQAIRVREFREVAMRDYGLIKALENAAIAANYSPLNL